MWWYRGLHALLLGSLERFAPKPFARMLDAGCGTGGFLRRAEVAWPSLSLDGIDRSPLAVGLARERVARATIAEGDVQALPYDDGRFDAIVLADVLYHREVDPARQVASLLGDELMRTGEHELGARQRTRPELFPVQ